MTSKVDLEINQGSDYSVFFVIRDSAGTVDLTGYKAAMQLRKQVSSQEADDTLSTENGRLEIFPTEGKVKVNFTNQVTSGYDSLQELAGAHVRYDAAQELSPEQKSQARSNIGAADDADYQTTKTQVNTNKTAIGTLSGLSTTAKTDLVSAINEVKTQADKGVSDAAMAKSAADAAQSTATAAQSAASNAQSDVDALEAAIGTTDTNFAKVYTDARDGASE